jgi:PBP superfamily domain
MRYSREISLAVAMALGAPGIASAAPPSLQSAASATLTLSIAGPTAARYGLIYDLQINLCGPGNSLTVTGTSGGINFYAVSCVISASTGLQIAGQLATVYFREQDDAIVGAVPLITGRPVSQLNLSDTTNIPVCPPGATSCVANVGAGNFTSDSFTGAVAKRSLQLGMTDLEPAIFVADNYPTAFGTSAYGIASPAQMAVLTSSAQPLFQEVFGLFVNVNSAPFLKSGSKPTSLNISKAALTNVLQGNLGDWSLVSDTSGNPIASAQAPIQIVNRESGAGSRAATAVYFTGDECNPSASTLADSAGAAGDFFSTANVLSAANTTTGAITYASIDNYSTTTYPNLVLVNINGIPPSNLAAAEGQYDFWFEGTAQTAPTITGNQTVLVNWLIGELESETTTSGRVDIDAIPGLGASNNAAIPASGSAFVPPSGTATIYVNDFTRAGSSCDTPLDAL